VLSQILADQINLINAGNFAKARGIEVVEVRSARRAAYANSLGVALRTGGETVSVLGMIGVNNALRILGVNNIDIDAPLTGFLLLFRNQDVPGVIRPRRHAARPAQDQHRQLRPRPRCRIRRRRCGIVNVDTHVVADPQPREKDTQEDPVLFSFLSFLAADMQRSPERITPLDAAAMKRIGTLVNEVKTSVEENLGDEALL
jgi:hypothetical protein